MLDPERWWRLLEHLLAEFADDVPGERAAVLRFADLHARLTRNGRDEP